MEETSHALFSIGPLEVTGTVTTMWTIIIVLTLLSWLATRNMKEVPGKLQNAAEMAVGYLQNYFKGTLGEKLSKGGSGDRGVLYQPCHRREGKRLWKISGRDFYFDDDSAVFPRDH